MLWVNQTHPEPVNQAPGASQPSTRSQSTKHPEPVNQAAGARSQPSTRSQSTKNTRSQSTKNTWSQSTYNEAPGASQRSTRSQSTKHPEPVNQTPGAVNQSPGASPDGTNASQPTRSARKQPTKVRQARVSMCYDLCRGTSHDGHTASREPLSAEHGGATSVATGSGD